MQATHFVGLIECFHHVFLLARKHVCASWQAKYIKICIQVLPTYIPDILNIKIILYVDMHILNAPFICHINRSENNTSTSAEDDASSCYRFLLAYAKIKWHFYDVNPTCMHACIFNSSK